MKSQRTNVRGKKPSVRALRAATFEALECRRLMIATDYGDAPDSYGTLLASGGPVHGVVGVRLGSDVSNDSTPQATAAADTDDDDGVYVGASLLQDQTLSGPSVSLTIKVNNPLSSISGEFLHGWIDFNQNGTFDAAEQIISNQDMAIGDNTVVVSIPGSAKPGTTYARFRIVDSSTPGLGPTGQTSPFTNGEIEDYRLTISRTESLVVTTTTEEDDGTSDPAFGTGTSLREAVTYANSNPDASVITFASALVASGPATLTAYTFDPLSEVGRTSLVINTPVTINGPAAGPDNSYGVTIEGKGLARLFAVTDAGSLTLDQLTLAGGGSLGWSGGSSVQAGGGGGGSAGLGGAIFNNGGTLTISRSLLKGNLASGGAGGIGAVGGSTGGAGGAGLGGPGGNFVAGGNAGGGGGGVAGPGQPNSGNTGGNGGIDRSGGFAGPGVTGGAGQGGGGGSGANSIGGAGGFGGGGGGGDNGGGTGGFGAGGGGAFSAGGNGGFGGGGAGAAITPGTGGFGGGNGTSDAANNRGGGGGAGLGGAIFSNGGTVTLLNSTFTANRAAGGTATSPATAGQGLGGAVFMRNGTLSLFNSTLSANTAAEGGRQIYAVGDGAAAKVDIVSSILGQTDSSITDIDYTDINAGTIAIFAFSSLFRNFKGMPIGDDPRVDALASNGGPTQTMALLPYSLAINTGNNVLGLTTDQRGAGFARVVGARADVGAFEIQQGPQVSISDVSLTESDSGTKAFTFDVTRTSSVGAASVDWATADGPNPGFIAQAGLDYQAASGTVNFAEGELTKTVTVNVFGDTNIESDQDFVVNLSNAVGVEIDDGQGVGTIQNDDLPPPTLNIADASITEGDSGTKNLNFVVELDRRINQPVTFKYGTASGTAASGSDFVAKFKTATMPAFAKTFVITIQVNGDRIREANETFLVNLSAPTVAIIGDGQAVGTIVNNDPLPQIRINNAPTITEGNAGTKLMTFTVTLDRASSTAVSVNFATADGTAKIALNDYIAKSGTVTFGAGQTSKTITVSVVGDTKKGINETLFVNLSNAIGGTIADGQGVGTILNDD